MIESFPEFNLRPTKSRDAHFGLEHLLAFAIQRTSYIGTTHNYTEH